MCISFKWLFFAIVLVVVTANAHEISGSGSGSGSGSRSSDADPLLSSIHQQLAQGKIIVVYQMQNDDKSSEQYADWASYLNDFSSTHVDNYRIHKTNDALNLIIASQQIDVTESYTLFIKTGSSSYFYQDVIVDAMVYFAVDQAYAGHIIDGHAAFLPDEVTVPF
jgi:hypothetical protein